MQSLFSRVKRQTNSVKTGDLQQFRARDNAYLQFINELKSVFTEPNEIYGNIKVTKRRDGITKVNIKDGATKVGFIYRNRDLYIIGFVTGSVFYIDKEVYDGLGKRIPNTWTSVIGTGNVVALSNPFSYNQILPSGENTELQIGKLGDSLTKLTQVGDPSKRSQIMTQHLGPFVVAFSEAIRFPVVAREVQGAIRKATGKVKLSKNLVKPLSLGHPSERTKGYVFSIYSLLLNWSKLSDRVVPLYSNPPQPAPALQDGKYTLHLEKNQLNTLLGVANSYRFSKINIGPSRGKRDLTSIFDSPIPNSPALLGEEQINKIDFEGNVGQMPPMPSGSGIASITHSPDVVGALHLLTVGLLYLYGRKMNVPIGNNLQLYDPREAYGIAVDLVGRIECFLKFSDFELKLGFEEQMQLQKQLAKALIRGEQVEAILTKVFERNLPLEKDDAGFEAFKQQLTKALATESGLLEDSEFEGDSCFK